MTEREAPGVDSILVVDDMAFMRRALSVIIKGAGYPVVEAASAKEAMRYLRMRTPRLIFLDVALPDVGGVELCRWIRMQPELRGVPVIMCTAKRERRDVEDAIKAGATDYLLKPLEPEAVRERIIRHIGGLPARPDSG